MSGARGQWSGGHGGNVWGFAAHYGLNPGRVLDFSANLNPAGPPPGVLAALRKAVDSIRHYPEPYAASLRDRLAAHLHVPSGALAVTAGAAEAIYLLARLARPSGRVLVQHPTFSEYERAAQAAGLPAVSVLPAMGDASGVSHSRLALGPEPDLAAGDLWFLCNPNNPDGRLLTRGEVLARADLASAAGATLVVDESFMDFVPDPPACSLLPEAASGRPGLWVVGSLTKFYALPGLRVGFLAGSDAGRFDRERDPWSVGTLAQAAAAAALEAGQYRQRTRDWIGVERPFLAGRLRELSGLQVYEPAANYILCRAPVPAAALQHGLARHAILIRDCANYLGLDSHHFRVAVRSRPENLRLLEALHTCL